MWWVVDRVEGRIAVLVSDAGQTIQLTGAFREGQVYRQSGRYLKRDTREERRRSAEARRQLERFKRSDPGGNIQL